MPLGSGRTLDPCSPALGSAPGSSALPSRAAATTVRRRHSRTTPCLKPTYSIRRVGSHCKPTAEPKGGNYSSGALALYPAEEHARAAARVSASLADADLGEGRLEDATARLEQAIAQLEHGEPSVELATALAQLGRTRVLAGHAADAAAPLERALTLSERLQAPDVFIEALISKALVLYYQSRLDETRILLEAAAERAHTQQRYASALRAENNLAVVLETSDRYAETLEFCERAVALARRRGERRWESTIRTGTVIHLFLLGRWDEALAVAAEEEPLAAAEVARSNLLSAVSVHCERGDREAARTVLRSANALRLSDNPQLATAYAVAEARMLRAEERPIDALASAERALSTLGQLPVTDTSLKMAVVEACEAALTLSDLGKSEEVLAILESLDPGLLTPFLQAQRTRLRARLDAARGDHAKVDEGYLRAANLFRELGLVFYLAVTQLEHAEWRFEQGRDDDARPLLVAARETFEHLRATPWLERAARASETREVPEGATL
jgi:tetratricopeptide (TPR) repeat protein